MEILKDNNLPEWIEPFATFGTNRMVLDNEITKDNSLWAYLALRCPNKYEKYLVILHPFWIYTDIEEEDSIKVNYSDLFNRFDKVFDLKNAIKTKSEIFNIKNWQTKKVKPSNYFSYPGKGEIEQEELSFISQCIYELYGNIDTDFFYVCMKSKNWDDGEDSVIRGKILDSIRVRDTISKIEGNPSAIYPTDKSDWCIISDYDLPFTFIGGKSDLIDKILTEKDIVFDFYELKQKFTAQKASR